MSAVSDINTKIAAAVAAQEAGDYATALTYLRSAKMLLASVPDAAGLASANLSWDRSAIDSMITELKNLAAASGSSSSGGIRRTKIKYVNPDSEDDD